MHNRVMGTVVGCDDFLKPGHDEDLHEFHVVVRVDQEYLVGDTAMFIRLRTNRGAPLRLLHFGTDEGATVEGIRWLLEVGERIEFNRGLVPACRRTKEFGYHAIDRVTDPETIQRVQVHRTILRVIEGGRAS
ncbi:MAG: hypothetical protein AAB839_00265 [Patescibacteria group bacterium]